MITSITSISMLSNCHHHPHHHDVCDLLTCECPSFIISLHWFVRPSLAQNGTIKTINSHSTNSSSIDRKPFGHRIGHRMDQTKFITSLNSVKCCAWHCDWFIVEIPSIWWWLNHVDWIPWWPAHGYAQNARNSIDYLIVNCRISTVRC